MKKLENQTWKEFIINRGHIFCPNCKAAIFPEIEGFTDEKPDGHYTCDECEFSFVLQVWE